MTDITTAANDVAEIAGKQAQPMEEARRLHPEVVEAVLAAGFARHFVPDQHGGETGTFTAFLDAIATIGESCPSTAWFASLTAGLGRMAAYLPPEAQDLLWADGPDPLVVGALMPLGRAEPVDGGWWLSGRWPYVSGIDHSRWALVCAMAGPARPGPAQARFFLIPRPAYAIVDSWFNVGMRATGSNTLVLEPILVPAGHSFSRDDVTEGRAPRAEPVHQVPLRAVNGLGFAAPMLGAARGALRSWTDLITAKNQHQRDSRIEIAARVAGEIDAASLLLERSAVLADRGRVTPGETARSWRDAALSADLLSVAVNRLVRTAGTAAQIETHPLQRYWRDVNAAATHVVLDFESAAKAYSSEAFVGRPS